MDIGEKRLGKAIKKARKEKNMTQAALAKEAGVSGMTIQRYETGKTVPDIGKLFHIASALSDTSLMESALQTDKCQGEGQNGTTKDVNRTLINLQIEKNDSEEYTKYLMIISMLLSSLNKTGMEKAAEIIEVYTKYPDYTKKEEK